VGLYQIIVKFKITAKVGSVSYKCFWNITFASLAGNDLGRGTNQRHPLPSGFNEETMYMGIVFAKSPLYWWILNTIRPF
jgi:hypothetical protein